MQVDVFKLVIAFPSTGRTVSEFAISLAALIAKVAAQGISTLPEMSVELSVDMVKSSSIHTNREQLVCRALHNQRTHLLFLDEDMSFDPRVLDILAGRRQSIVVTNYLIKTDSPDFVAVSLSGNRIPTLESSTGLLPIAYSGFGVSLFDLEVFRKTPQPWFLPEFNSETNCYTTEDNPCYHRLREAGFTVYLDQDASKLVDHKGDKIWNWREWKPQEKTNGSN